MGWRSLNSASLASGKYGLCALCFLLGQTIRKFATRSTCTKINYSHDEWLCRCCQNECMFSQKAKRYDQFSKIPSTQSMLGRRRARAVQSSASLLNNALRSTSSGYVSNLRNAAPMFRHSASPKPFTRACMSGQKLVQINIGNFDVLSLELAIASIHGFENDAGLSDVPDGFTNYKRR
jgi:hypothetical protein